jgi:hypothetical protein
MLFIKSVALDLSRIFHPFEISGSALTCSLELARIFLKWEIHTVIPLLRKYLMSSKPCANISPLPERCGLRRTVHSKRLYGKFHEQFITIKLNNNTHKVLQSSIPLSIYMRQKKPWINQGFFCFLTNYLESIITCTTSNFS